MFSYYHRRFYIQHQGIRQINTSEGFCMRIFNWRLSSHFKGNPNVIDVIASCPLSVRKWLKCYPLILSHLSRIHRLIQHIPRISQIFANKIFLIMLIHNSSIWGSIVLRCHEHNNHYLLIQVILRLWLFISLFKYLLIQNTPLYTAYGGTIVIL